MRTVNELTQEELEELRERWVYSEDRTIEEIDKYDSSDEVPMDLVKSHFSMYLFTEEDFFCNLSKSIENPVPIKHNKLRDILQKYGSPEWGDCIIDEICALFNFPITSEE